MVGYLNDAKRPRKKKNRDFVSEYITSNTSFFTVPLHVKYLRRSLDILSMPNSLGTKREEFGFLMIEAHIRNTRNDTLRWVPCILVLHK